MKQAVYSTRRHILPKAGSFRYRRLKLRILPSGQAQLIHYDRPDQAGPKRSSYHIFRTNDPEGLTTTLSKALGIRGVLRKTRHLYMIGQTCIHLDDVAGLGHFVGLEVVLSPEQSDADGQVIAQDLMAKLGIGKDDLIEGGYVDLWKRPVQFAL